MSNFWLGKIVKNDWSLYLNNKKVFFVCVYIYKMFNITKETIENNDIEVKVDSANSFWLNEKNIKEKFNSHLK